MSLTFGAVMMPFPTGRYTPSCRGTEPISTWTASACVRWAVGVFGPVVGKPQPLQRNGRCEIQQVEKGRPYFLPEAAPHLGHPAAGHRFPQTRPAWTLVIGNRPAF